MEIAIWIGGIVFLSLLWSILQSIGALHQTLSGLAAKAGWDRVRVSTEEAKESVEEVKELIDSLHRVLGGRQYQRDELDKDLDGPTIQELLQSINEHLGAAAPDSPKRGQSGLVRLVR